MSQQTWGNFVLHISEERMMEIVPNELSNLKELYELFDLSYKNEAAMQQDDYIDELTYNISSATDDTEIIDKFVDAWSDLQTAFKSNTGIELEIIYLESGVNEWHGQLSEGVNFTLSFYDCYMYTPAFSALQSNKDKPIDFETFTTTG